MTTFLLSLIYLVGLALCATHGCLDENEEPVDWWVIMKAPILTDTTDPTWNDGYGYAYADANSPRLKLSSVDLSNNSTSNKGALKNTLKLIYAANPSSTLWMIYNDEWPDNSDKGSYGHTKGFLYYRAGSGYWVSHSTPRFPEGPETAKHYNFPANEAKYGQHFICLSIGPEEVESIASGFILNKPAIYSSNLPDSLAATFPNVSLVLAKKFITTEPKSQMVSIRSLGGTSVNIFAKNAKIEIDLWEDLVQQYYKQGMLIESWQNGANTNKMPTYCTPDFDYDSINIRSIYFTDQVQWDETQDHSKWGVALDKTIYCFGDENRQFSQAKRGGGAMCFDGSLWGSLNKIIATNDTCPV
eukprot:CAMPEP_0174260090 /NCGR_PEP_ID=MMETSP0439-20130205/8834_1 /TAXON_ID=0 /ORGANISM="Stereomyxa ramosa, Strain Chinc5" /LENGTH=356 /DNA_ID=CAMNT_0015344243 /DNA_START=40 /DNA_END=1107 /DNA_ORIENTATION=+